MDITLQYFLRHGGISSKLLNEIAKENRYVDFLFLNKRILNTKFFASSRFNRINRIINKHDIILHPSVLESIYLLAAFKAPVRTLNILFEEGYTNIKSLAKLNSYEFNEIINVKTNKSYNKVVEGITKYTAWIEKNTDIVIELIILDYLQHNQEVLVNNLLNHVQQYFQYKSLIFEKDLFYKVLENMQDIKLIQVSTKDNVELYQLKLVDMLSYNFENSDIFRRYIKGDTFREIAEDRGVKHQRIQQIYSGLMELMPLLEEDIKYKDIFTRYDFSKDNFLGLFEENVKVYNYLNYKYKKGDEHVIAYLMNNHYSDDYIIEFAKNLKPGYLINYENEIEPINKLNLINNHMYENRDKKLTINNLMQEINKVFIEYIEQGIKPYEDIEDIGSLQNLVDYSQRILSSNDGTFRYYNLEGLSPEDIYLLEEVFDLPEGVYNAHKIYDKNIEVMEELRLLNGNELLDLYNKLNLNLPSVYGITRRTEVQIGSKEKETFIKEILIEFNGESLSDALWYLFDEYGLQKDSLRSYVLDKLNYLIVDGKIKIDQPETAIEKITEYVNNTLNAEVYSLRETNNKISKIFKETISINNFMLKNTDYKVRDRYVIQKKYTTPIEAIQDWIMRNDFFNLTEAKLMTDLSKSSFFYNATNELLRNFEIFRFNENLFITKDRLNEAGIYQTDINDFIHSVEQHYAASSKKYVTMKSLIKEGFNHPLIQKGFENIFYAEILRNSSKLETIYTSPRMFYGNGSITKNRTDFIYYLINNHYSIDYQDLINILLDDYGLSYDQSTINSMLVDTEAFYSDETKKYYKNKDQYYMEVYGR